MLDYKYIIQLFLILVVYFDNFLVINTYLFVSKDMLTRHIMLILENILWLKNSVTHQTLLSNHQKISIDILGTLASLPYQYLQHYR